MPFQKYEPLKQLPSDGASDGQLAGSDTFPHSRKKLSTERAWNVIYILFALLGISITSNIALFAKLRTGLGCNDVSSLTGLEWNIPVKSENRALDLHDPEWDNPDLQTWVGYVALDHNTAMAHGAPQTQDWPWDHSKGIYILQAWHSLHCINALRHTLVKLREGGELQYTMGHLSHCLLLLRNEITCKADDTLLYTGHYHVLGNKTEFDPPGHGQTRVCRDFSKLIQFARDNSACYYRPIEYYTPPLERYKYCPDGSKPWNGKEGANGHE